MKVLTTLTIFLVTVGFANAQTMPEPGVPQGENLKVPDGWEFRLDSPNDTVVLTDNAEDEGIFFVNMTPGWHLTTGPRGIFWHPAFIAEDSFSIYTDLHLFNPNGRNREGYGLFFGGKNMKTPEYEYLYFLIRNTGDFLIKKRIGETTETIQGWTESNLINIYDDPEVSSVLNSLAVVVAGNTMNFFINNEQVATINATDLELDANGIFGLRVNHAVNLHVEDIGVSTE